MSLVINSNVSALFAQAAGHTNEKQVARAIERLSSGSRINSARDDAAGLAISTNMQAQIQGVSVALRNSNDGLSMLQTADGALGTIQAILQRARELAVQSSNGTNNTRDRVALNTEVNALFSEIQRIASDTSFNGIQLLDGTFENKQLQIGASNDPSDRISISINSAKVGSNEGELQLEIAQEKTYTYTTTYSANVSGRTVGDTALMSGELTINGISIGGSSSASARDIAAAINQKVGLTGVKATAQTTFSSSTGITVPTTPSETYDPDTVNVSVTPALVSESGSTKLTYTFTRTGDISQELTVNFNLGGTASKPDFTTSSPIASALEPIKDWTRLLGTTSNDAALASTTGSDGSIYICGYTDGAIDGQSNYGYRDVFVAKYKPDGTKVWTRQLGTSNDDEGWALTTGLDGSIYLSGYTTGNLEGQSNSGGYDAFLMKLNPDGNKDWTKLIGDGKEDRAFALTTGLDGSIYVSGNSFLSKFNTDGSIDWAKIKGTDNNVYLNINSLSTGVDGSIFGTSGTSVTKFNPNGNIEWTSQTGGVNDGIRLWALAPGQDGSIYVSGSTWGMLDGQPYVSGGGFDAFITKFNPDGTKAWTREQGTYDNDHPFGLTTGLDGSIYVTGRAGMLEPATSMDGQPYNWINQTDVFVTKYNPDGTKVWTRLLTSSGVDEPRSLTTGLDGSIYVSGYTNGSLDGQVNGGGNDAFLTKILVSPQITFAAGSSTAFLLVDPSADNISEVSETLIIELMPGENYFVGTSSATGTIVEATVFPLNSIASGDITLNGVNLGAIPSAQTAAQRSAQMLSAINAKTAITGVTANIDSSNGGILMSCKDGRNIEISTLTASNITGDTIGIYLNNEIIGNRSVTTFRSSINLSSTSSAGIDLFVTSEGESSSGFGSIFISSSETTTAQEDPSKNNGGVASVATVDISTIEGAQNSISSLDNAIELISNSRASIGAYQNRILSTFENLTTRHLNLSKSLSNIKDTDYAVETANLAKWQIIQKASTAMLAQANQTKQSVLALLK